MKNKKTTVLTAAMILNMMVQQQQVNAFAPKEEENTQEKKIDQNVVKNSNHKIKISKSFDALKAKDVLDEFLKTPYISQVDLRRSLDSNLYAQGAYQIYFFPGG